MATLHFIEMCSKVDLFFMISGNFYLCLLAMRVVKEINDKACKITVFSWNGKFLIKLEQGMFEQTYKVSELDVFEQQFDEILNKTFMDEALKRFEGMEKSLGKSISAL